MKVIQVAIKWTIKLGVKFPPHVSHSSLILCVVEVGVSGRKHGVQRLESMLPTAILMLCKISETVTEIRKVWLKRIYGWTDWPVEPIQNPRYKIVKKILFLVTFWSHWAIKFTPNLDVTRFTDGAHSYISQCHNECQDHQPQIPNKATYGIHGIS